MGEINPLFRWLSADRGDGRARARDAAARADEAARPHQCASTRQETLCRRAVATRQQARYALQYRRLPDEAEAWRSAQDLQDHPGARNRGIRLTGRRAP